MRGARAFSAARHLSSLVEATDWKVWMIRRLSDAIGGMLHACVGRTRQIRVVFCVQPPCGLGSLSTNPLILFLTGNHGGDRETRGLTATLRMCKLRKSIYALCDACKK